MPLSAVLITFNAAGVLPDCLASLGFADEIVVVDGGSSDDTRDIALKAGARVLEHPWSGFGAQKRFAVASARYDWVFCIDADERVPDPLATTLVRLAGDPPGAAIEVPRSNYFLGRYLRHGEGYPDWSLRLFDRRYANWSEDIVHEKVICATGSVKVASGGALLHHSADSLADYLGKQNRYTTLQAEALFKTGQRATLARMIAAPLVRFIKFYLLRAGFLDGMPGLVHITIGCFNSFMKYAKLRELEAGGS